MIYDGHAYCFPPPSCNGGFADPADRILWGTDIPIVLLHWIYRQSLDYVRRYCPFLSKSEMAAILGGNMERLLGR